MTELEEQYNTNMSLLQERIASLELALEDVGWMRFTVESEQEFSREGLKTICQLARLFYLKNPLIKRGVNVQRDYVFGQGVTIHAQAEAVDKVIQQFLLDSKNQAELTGHQALGYKEVDLTIEANIFFVFFTNPKTGHVRVRSIPFDEIADVITNPDDAKDPWYYKRQWSEARYNMESGGLGMTIRNAYYPDWRYNPSDKPKTIGSVSVEWDSPVYHVRVGGFSRDKFGVSEVYDAIDWAKAYKSFLEDWATITRAYSRFAWQLTVKGGKAGIAAAKTKLNTTLSTSSADSNPPPVAGSTFIGGDQAQMNPIRTAGATTSAEDGRRLLLMVAAGLGLPETFFGDTSVGSLATAKSLDRPTELKIKSRQSLWSDILTDITDYVVLQAVIAGTLPGRIEEDDDGTPTVILADDPETNEPMSASVSVEFPTILEHSVTETVTSVIDAATMRGMASAGTMDKKTISRMLLTALGVDDVEAALAAIEQEEEEQEEEPTPPIPTQEQPPVVPQAEAALLEAVKELRKTLEALNA